METVVLRRLVTDMTGRVDRLASSRNQDAGKDNGGRSHPRRRLIRGRCFAAAPGQDGVHGSAVLSNGGGLRCIPGDCRREPDDPSNDP